MLAPGREGLPGGQPGGLAPDPPPGLVAAADLFFEQDADHLGGVPPLGAGGGEHFGRGLAEVGEAHPAQHGVEVVRDRRRDGGGGGQGGSGHGWPAFPHPARGGLPLAVAVAVAVGVGWAGGRGERAGEVAPVGALGLQQLLGALGAGALGGGERGNGVQLCLVLVAEGVAFAGGVGARARSVSARASASACRARLASVSARRAASIASSRSRAAWPASDCAALTCPAASARAAAMWPAASRRACSAAAAAVPASWRAAAAAAWAAQTSSRAVSRASARAWASAAASPAQPGGDGGGFGAAAGGLGLGDLGPDPGRVQAGGLLAGGPDEDGGLPDHALQRGQRVRRGIGGHGCRDGDAGVVVVAAGALVAAELPGAAAVLGGQDVSAARPLAEGCRGRAGLLSGGGIAGHDGTFRYQPLLFFSFLLRSEMKRKRGAAGDGDRGPGFLPGPAGRAGTGRVRTLRPCGPRFRRGAAGTTR